MKRSLDQLRQPRSPEKLPRWVIAFLRVPLFLKIAGANAVIVIAAAVVAMAGDLVSQDGGLWLLLLAALGMGMAANAVLVYIALRPLNELERTARRVWQGELEARVPASSMADAGIKRVGNTLNLLLDGLSADQARLRALANQVIQAGDRERASLARELHDSTAQSLAALLLELSVLACENGDPKLDDRITRIRSIVGDVLDEVRLLAHTVHPRVLDDLGLVAALELLSRESGERSSVNVTYAGPSKVEGLDATCSSALYRVAQEAVGNAIRHARATAVSVRLREQDGEVELEISDDGIGFVPEEVARRRPGMGLFTMRERAALVGGRLMVQSSDGQGTRVMVAVPRASVPPAPLVGVGHETAHSWHSREDV